MCAQDIGYPFGAADARVTAQYFLRIFFEHFDGGFGVAAATSIPLCFAAAATGAPWKQILNSQFFHRPIGWSGLSLAKGRGFLSSSSLMNNADIRGRGGLLLFAGLILHFSILRGC